MPLTCACCYAETAPLVQFFNQDRGFGLCSGCADWIERRNGPEYLLAHYGRRGVHIEDRSILNG